MNLSIVEFGFYGFLAYTSFLMLIVSIIKDVPDTRISALLRTLFILPGIVACAILVTSGPDIMLDTVHTINLTNATGGITNDQIFYEETTTTDRITLLNPVWSSVHFILFFVMIIYVIKQMLLMLGVGKEKIN